jgi:hypothetical protein
MQVPTGPSSSSSSSPASQPSSSTMMSQDTNTAAAANTARPAALLLDAHLPSYRSDIMLPSYETPLQNSSVAVLDVKKAMDPVTAAAAAADPEDARARDRETASSFASILSKISSTSSSASSSSDSEKASIKREAREGASASARSEETSGDMRINISAAASRPAPPGVYLDLNEEQQKIAKQFPIDLDDPSSSLWKNIKWSIRNWTTFVRWKCESENPPLAHHLPDHSRWAKQIGGTTPSLDSSPQQQSSSQYTTRSSCASSSQPHTSSPRAPGAG